MMWIGRCGLVAGVLALSACGSTTEESAATGGLGGAAIGAVAGGPVGAVIGLGAGAATGAGVQAGQEKGVIPPEPGDRPVQQSAQQSAGNVDVRHAQLALRDQGLYDGPIDGVSGPRTRHALSLFQRHQGLPQTARLDNATRDALQSEVAAVPEERRRGEGR